MIIYFLKVSEEDFVHGMDWEKKEGETLKSQQQQFEYLIRPEQLKV